MLARCIPPAIHPSAGVVETGNSPEGGCNLELAIFQPSTRSPPDRVEEFVVPVGLLRITIWHAPPRIARPFVERSRLSFMPGKTPRSNERDRIIGLQPLEAATDFRIFILFFFLHFFHFISFALFFRFSFLIFFWQAHVANPGDFRPAISRL